MTDFNRSVLPDVVRSNGATPNPWWANAVGSARTLAHFGLRPSLWR